MEVGDMLNARNAAVANAQLSQQLQQAAHLDSSSAYGLNPNHAGIDQSRSMTQHTPHLAYTNMNVQGQNHQLHADTFMMGQSHRDSEEIDVNTTSRQAAETTSKSFACSTCAKGFARRSDLARHERIHSGDRPHACDWPGCGKQFIQRSALTVHARVHTGEKPHMCERCGKPFSDSSSLARHRRIHSGKRPYKCPYANCQKTFTRKTTLTRHQNHHTGTVEQAAVETNAKLSNTPSASGHLQDAEYSDNNSSRHSTGSPINRPVSMSPGQELAAGPDMHRQSSQYGYLPQNGTLPPHLRTDYPQNPSRSSPAMNHNTMSYTSNPHHRQSMTSHPNTFGPPQPLEPPANGTTSGSGSPHLGALNWGSPGGGHGNLPSPGPIDNYAYPDPTYGGAHVYFPGSNIRRPQSTEPEDYGLRPRGNQSINHNANMHAINSHMGNVMGTTPQGHYHGVNAGTTGVEWSHMPVGGQNYQMNQMPWKTESS